MDSFIERRVKQRKSLAVPATVVSVDGLARRSVTIVNISDTGAMLDLGGDWLLPRAFTLLFRQTLQPCHLVWQTERFGGVQFDP